MLLAPSPSALQSLLSICEDFANENEIVYNSKKTVCMNIVPKSLKGLHVPSMFLSGKELKWAEEHKCLGVFANKIFSDIKDLKNQMRSVYSKGNMLISKFRKCSDSVKVQLFKTFCTNVYIVLVYGIILLILVTLDVVLLITIFLEHS